MRQADNKRGCSKGENGGGFKREKHSLADPVNCTELEADA